MLTVWRRWLKVINVPQDKLWFLMVFSFFFYYMIYFWSILIAGLYVIFLIVMRESVVCQLLDKTKKHGWWLVMTGFICRLDSLGVSLHVLASLLFLKVRGCCCYTDVKNTREMRKGCNCFSSCDLLTLWGLFSRSVDLQWKKKNQRYTIVFTYRLADCIQINQIWPIT